MAYWSISFRTLPARRSFSASVRTGLREKIAMIKKEFKRYTVTFSDVNFKLDADHLNVWYEHKLKPVLDSFHERWKQDPRIFRACQVNDRGFATLMVPWGKDDCASDAEFAEMVAKALFIGDSILEHDVVLRTRLRSGSVAIGACW